MGGVLGHRDTGRNAAFTPRMDGVPALGQHSQGILDQLGYCADTIDSLRARGII